MPAGRFANCFGKGVYILSTATYVTFTKQSITWNDVFQDFTSFLKILLLAPCDLWMTCIEIRIKFILSLGEIYVHTCFLTADNELVNWPDHFVQNALYPFLSTLWSREIFTLQAHIICYIVCFCLDDQKNLFILLCTFGIWFVCTKLSFSVCSHLGDCRWKRSWRPTTAVRKFRSFDCRPSCMSHVWVKTHKDYWMTSSVRRMHNTDVII